MTLLHASPSYLLIFLALSVLFARTTVVALIVVGTLPEASHHVLEHGLDFTMAGFVLIAVHAA